MLVKGVVGVYVLGVLDENELEGEEDDEDDDEDNDIGDEYNVEGLINLVVVD